MVWDSNIPVRMFFSLQNNMFAIFAWIVSYLKGQGEGRLLTVLCPPNNDDLFWSRGRQWRLKNTYSAIVQASDALTQYQNTTAAAATCQSSQERWREISETHSILKQRKTWNWSRVQPVFFGGLKATHKSNKSALEVLFTIHDTMRLGKMKLLLIQDFQVYRDCHYFTTDVTKLQLKVYHECIW